MSNSTYDPVSESWLTYDNPLTLEVLGATTPAWTHTIDQVTLYVSVPQQYYNESGSITIQGLPSPDEDDPVTDVTVLLGAGGIPPAFGTPLLPLAYPGDTPKEVPLHGIFPTAYWAVSLPDLMVEDAGETVFNYNPGETGTDTGDIQSYQVKYSGLFWIHFDLGGVAHNGHLKTTFAPFSHDADAVLIPEPATLALLGSGLAGMVFFRRRRGRR